MVLDLYALTLNALEDNYMNNLMSDYQRVIAMSRYARWNGEKQRRETWQETVTRLLNFYKDYLKNKHS